MDNAEENFVPSGGERDRYRSEILFMNSSKEENRRDLEGERERDTCIYLSRLTGVSMLFEAYLFARGRSGRRACAPSAMYTGTRIKTSAGKREEMRDTKKIYAHATRLTSNANLRAKTNGDEIRKGGTVDGRREGERVLVRQGAYTISNV